MSQNDVYELLKWYPSLPRDWEVGMRLGHGDRSPNSLAPVNSKYSSKWLAQSEVMNSDEFWKLVKAPTYNITYYSKGTLNNPDIFRVVNKVPLTLIDSEGKTKKILDKSDYRIHTVDRNPDYERLHTYERFHLGDLVNYEGKVYEIREFIENKSPGGNFISVKIAIPKLSAPYISLNLQDLEKGPTVLDMRNSLKDKAIEIMKECIEKLEDLDETS